jgi:hypothetical protein
MKFTAMHFSETKRSIANRVVRAVAIALGVAIVGAPAAALQPAQLRVILPAGQTVAVASVPYAVGEELTYRATFGGIPAGSARMRVDGIEIVRGRPAYHVVFSVDGGVPLFRVHDRYESWIDVETLASLRHRQQVSEGRYHRTTSYEIYPERAEYQKLGDSVRASVSNPLDDGSFIYAVRTAGVGVGETRRDDRYFRPDRNPVVLTGLRRDTVTVAAGTFATTVVRPTIRTSGIFSDDGQAQVWFTDDENRYPVQVKAKFAKFTLTLSLQSVARGIQAAALPALIAQAGEPNAAR